MFKVCKLLFLITFISCSVSKPAISFKRQDEINRLMLVSATIIERFPKSIFGLSTFGITDTAVKDSLEQLRISTLSVKYSNDTVNVNEYFYGNKNQLPDSCIIFEREYHATSEDRIASSILFYFFGQVKPLNFQFTTHRAESESIRKISDSIWVYNSVHQLITIH